MNIITRIDQTKDVKDVKYDSSLYCGILTCLCGWLDGKGQNYLFTQCFLHVRGKSSSLDEIVV